MVTLHRSNQTPTIEQLLALAGRAGGKPLRSIEVVTLQRGIRSLAALAGTPGSGPIPRVSPPSAEKELRLLLDTALQLYASAYGLSRDQAETEVRAEAGL